MKMLTGFVLGVVFVLVLGITYTSSTWVGGWLSTPPFYEGNLSGVGPNGQCYFALTSTVTGRTEITRISEKEPNQISIQMYFSDKAFEKGRDGRVIFKPDTMKESEDYIKNMKRLTP